MIPITDRVIERTAHLLLERILSVPDGKPRVDPDGDLLCPDCPRLFVSVQALRVHRARAHKNPGASP